MTAFRKVRCWILTHEKYFVVRVFSYIQKRVSTRISLHHIIEPLTAKVEFDMQKYSLSKAKSTQKRAVRRCMGWSRISTRGTIYLSGQRAFKQSIKVILISQGANLHLRWKMRAPLSAVFSRFSCTGYDEVTFNLSGLARYRWGSLEC